MSVITDFEMIAVSGGSYEMGCRSGCFPGETPLHQVEVGDFHISRYEITNKQYAGFLNAIGADADGTYEGRQYADIDTSTCFIKHDGDALGPENGKADYPVSEVSWYGAQAFCAYYDGRLPTGAEWEFAAHGGNQAQNTLYSGSDELDIYDMSGNGAEWCADY